MTGLIELRIAELAGVQHGVVSRGQLIALGLTPRQVDRRLGNGRLQPIHRGIYLVGPRVSSHAREMGAVLACGDGAVLSHRSAAVLWDLLPPLDQEPGQPKGPRPLRAGSHPSSPRMKGERLDPVHVSRRGGDRGRSLAGIRVHRVARLHAGDSVLVTGIPVTAPLRTLLDLAWAETSRHPDDRVTQREVEQAVAQADRKGLVELSDLATLAVGRPSPPGRGRGQGRGHPGAPLLKTLLESETRPALTRSEAEERFLSLVRQAQLPAPATNAQLGAYEVDFLWPTLGLGVEVDGFEYHASRRRFEEDRVRDAELAARGVHMTRVTWRQIRDEPLAVLGRIARAMGQADRA